jgi:hypothetical protein
MQADRHSNGRGFISGTLVQTYRAKRVPSSHHPCGMFPWPQFSGLHSCHKRDESTSAKGPIPVAAPSKAWICGRSLAGIVGSNPTAGMDVCLVQCLCCQVEVSARGRSLVQGVLPTVVCVWWVWSSECKQPRHLLWVGRRSKDCETEL